jgi:hypothetical protein
MYLELVTADWVVMDLSGGEPPFLTCSLLSLNGANEG